MRQWPDCPGAQPITAAAPRRIHTVFPILPRARTRAGGTYRGLSLEPPLCLLSTMAPGLHARESQCWVFGAAQRAVRGFASMAHDPAPVARNRGFGT
jgi:hypothetical protein